MPGWVQAAMAGQGEVVCACLHGAAGADVTPPAQPRLSFKPNPGSPGWREGKATMQPPSGCALPCLTCSHPTAQQPGLEQPLHPNGWHWESTTMEDPLLKASRDGGGFKPACGHVVCPPLTRSCAFLFPFSPQLTLLPKHRPKFWPIFFLAKDRMCMMLNLRARYAQT